MQGSFEKKVQEKLDELKMNPAAPVWEKIELQIKPDRKRRRAMFWVPFLIFMLAATGWWLYNGNGDKSVAGNKQTPTGTADLPVVKQNDVTPQESKTLVPKTNQANNSNTTIATTKKENFNLSPSNNSSQQTEKIKQRDLKPVPPAEPKYQPATTARNVNNDATVNLTQDAVTMNRSAVAKEPIVSNELSVATERNTQTPTADTALKVEIEVEKLLPVPLADSSKAKTKIATASEKWQKAITLQGGFNQTVGAILSANRDVFAAPQQQSGPGTTSANMPAFASSVTGGSSFGVGAGVVRTLSKHFELSIGLQYAYHRLHTKVGAFRQIDTSLAFRGQRMQVDGYYRNGNQSDYTINYHLLELPVSIGYRPFASVPLTLSAGASYGRLLHSNALTYNSVAGGYYYNRENIHTDYFSLFSSLQYSIINRPGCQFSIGPLVHYQLTPLQKESYSRSGRLFVAGIKASTKF